MLARYMLCWQIHRWERDEPLIIAYRDFTGCSLMPGVPLKYMPGMRAGKSKEHKALAIGRVDELTTMSRWKERWLGADYQSTATTWRYFNSGSKDAKRIALKHTPPLGALLPDDIQKDLDSYYEKLAKLDASFKTSELDSSDDDTDDNDNDDNDTDDNDTDDNESVPVSGTPSVVGPEDNPDDTEEGDDISDETDEFDNEDTIALLHSEDTPLAAGAPSVDADPNDIPPPIDDILPSIDVALPPTNGTPPPIDITLPPINDTSASIDNVPPSADEGFSLVDDPLTPLENTPEPIDVDLPPPTDNGPSPVSDVPSQIHPQEDIVMHESEQDADGDTNAMTLSGMSITSICKHSELMALPNTRYHCLPYVAISPNHSDVRWNAYRFRWSNCVNINLHTACC